MPNMADNSTKLIDEVDKQSEKYFFESEILPIKKYSEKVVGEVMKKRLLTSEEDCLVFLEHPSGKNRGYKGKFESFAKDAVKFQDLKVMRIKAINENDQFKFT